MEKYVLRLKIQIRQRIIHIMKMYWVVRASLDLNFRMTEMTAALALSQWKKLQQVVAIKTRDGYIFM